MLEGSVTYQTFVTLSFDAENKIRACARDLSLSFDEVLRAVVNTSVRRHFEGKLDVIDAEGGDPE